MPHCQGELIGPGAEQGALDPDDVAQINEFFKAGEGLLAQHLLLEIDLQAAGAVLDMGEAGLAELPQEHEAAGQAEVVWPRPSNCSPLRAPKSSITWAMAVAGGELVVIGIDPLVPQLLEFLQTLLTDLVG